jgi:hypothetical protein
VQSRQSGLHAGYKKCIGMFSPFREKRFSEYGEKKRAKALIFGTPAGSVIGMVVFYLLNAKGYFMKHGARKRARASSETVAARNELIRKLKHEQPDMTTAEIVRQVQIATGEVITSGNVYAALKTPGPTRQAVSHTHGNLPHSPRLPAAAFANGSGQPAAVDQIAAPLGDMIEASKFVQTVGSIERAILALNRIRNISNPQSNLEAIEA